jgi:hypothetical protein
LILKNKTQATIDAKRDWDELELRGLTAGFEKGETIDEITKYYIIKYSAWNRMDHDKLSQWASMYAIDQTKPKALKVLDPVRWSGSMQRSTNNLNFNGRN